MSVFRAAARRGGGPFIRLPIGQFEFILEFKIFDFNFFEFNESKYKQFSSRMPTLDSVDMTSFIVLAFSLHRLHHEFKISKLCVLKFSTFECK